MGTMLQEADPSLADFEGHEGCNEVLNVTRPDIVAGIHAAYLAVGVDAIETNTFGANLGNLAEYDIADRIAELALAGAQIARRAADEVSSPEHPRYVLGSIGPGTRLPTLGHAPFADLRDAYATAARALLEGGSDCLLIETVQDILQAKAAILGAQSALSAGGFDTPILVQITVETTGTMLLGTETGAALTALTALGIDGIGLNCATGPAEMSEHLRQLSQQARIPVTVMPNAGLPILGADGASYPLTPDELAAALSAFVGNYATAVIGGCCGTTPAHMAAVVRATRHRQLPERSPEHPASVSSLYTSVPLRQQATYLAVGERANANGSRAFREALLTGDLERCTDIAREQTRDGAHVLDLCVDYVGRDGVADMRELASRLATASTLPIMIDSTEPEVIAAGLACLGGRAIVNSVNFEDGDGPDSRFVRTMRLVREHGAAVVALTIDETGQARTCEHKVAIAERLIERLTVEYGMSPADILVDCLTFPIATGQEETRRDGVATLAAIAALRERHPQVQTVLGLSNISFGLNPAARQVLNSVFLHEAIAMGLTAAIVHPSRILPMSRIDAEQRRAALDLIHDRRQYDAAGALTHDPLAHFLTVFADATAQGGRGSTAAELAGLPLPERLQRRIIDGERQGLGEDLDEAMTQSPPLAIINDMLLPAMRTVGDLFAAGEMQLPFVLQSAEVMKLAVGHLEPHMERTGESGKGTIVLATVKGDVHDIGKNLVDIILTNNGYHVVNIGIKQPLTSILEAAEVSAADAIGMSGLLVKSTVIMRENLEELNARGVAARFPVLLGGAALTRAYVEEDLAAVYQGEVRYAKDAFEGLALMDALMAIKRGEPGAGLPELRGRRTRRTPVADAPATDTALADAGVTDAGGLAGAATATLIRRSETDTSVPIPAAPFHGARVVKGIPLADYAGWLDERATFMGQWGLKSTRGEGPDYDELVAREGRPRLRSWLDRVLTEGMLEAGVVYGYFPAVADGDDIVILHHEGPQAGAERVRWTFPRQASGRRLCLADYLRPADSGEVDVLALHVVTMGNRISEAAGALFAADAYREYLELHGLSVQLTEALAEYWHARIRREWGIAGGDAPTLPGILKQGYQGERFSFGYPACPDLAAQVQVTELLDPGRIGVTLSEEYQLHPEQSTSALIFHHPQAAYFSAR